MFVPIAADRTRSVGVGGPRGLARERVPRRSGRQWLLAARRRCDRPVRRWAPARSRRAVRAPRPRSATWGGNSLSRVNRTPAPSRYGGGDRDPGGGEPW